MPFFSTDQLDDPLSYEVCPSWSGGQVSFVRANQLEPSQAEKIDNYFIHLTGILQKRRGIKNLVEDYVAGTNNRVQALFWWDISGDQELIAFADGNAHAWTVQCGHRSSRRQSPIRTRPSRSSSSQMTSTGPIRPRPVSGSGRAPTWSARSPQAQPRPFWRAILNGSSPPVSQRLLTRCTCPTS